MRKGFKTTEFICVCLWLGVLFASQFYLANLGTWAYLWSLTAISYLVSRTFYKKDRSFEFSQGYQSTEFYIMLAGVLGFLYPFYTNRIDLETVLKFGTAILAAYIFARGYGKSLIGGQTYVQSL